MIEKVWVKGGFIENGQSLKPKGNTNAPTNILARVKLNAVSQSILTSIQRLAPNKAITHKNIIEN